MTTKTMTKEEFNDMCQENIGDDEMFQYLTAKYGEYFGIYNDGSVEVGESVKNEIAEDERPLASIKCGNPVDAIALHGEIRRTDSEKANEWGFEYIDASVSDEDIEKCSTFEELHTLHVQFGIYQNENEIIEDCIKNGDINDLRVELIDKLIFDFEETF